MFTEYDDIQDITGLKESTCACKECIKFCHDQPCIGTPEDILNIIKGGHTNRIVMTKWAGGIKQGIPVISMLQPYYDPERKCCSFMDETKKKCILHDDGLKPTEGKLQHHTIGALGVKMGVYLPVGHAVALTWTEDKNVPVVMEIYNEVKAQTEKFIPGEQSI